MRALAVAVLLAGAVLAADASAGGLWRSGWPRQRPRRVLLQAAGGAAAGAPRAGGPAAAKPGAAAPAAAKVGAAPAAAAKMGPSPAAAAAAPRGAAAAPAGVAVGAAANGTAGAPARGAAKPKKPPVVTKAIFMTLWQNDRDLCESCPDFGNYPNSKDALARQWKLFKKAQKEMKFRFKNAAEAAAFFGSVKFGYNGALDRLVEECARLGAAQTCRAGPKFYGRGPLMLAGADNYAAMGRLLGANLTANPDLLVDANSTLPWKAAMAFWSKSKDFACMSEATKGPTCPQAAREDDVAGVVRRLAPELCIEISQRTNPNWEKQAARIDAINRARSAFSLPPFNPIQKWCAPAGDGAA